MNFYMSELLVGRQRGRQWLPLITQQFRLRHLYKLICYNLLPETHGNFYFTLHLATMCSPFYTSEQVSNPHPKWLELDLRNVPNTSASCIVLRIWQSTSDGDRIVLTWGVHFSGLVYVGNKLADIQPIYFKRNSVIFSLAGGFFTSHQMIRSNMQKPIPFLASVNVVNTMKDPIIFKRVAVSMNRQEIQSSYNIEKLRKLHSLQLQIKNKTTDVQNIREKINSVCCIDSELNYIDSRESIPIQNNLIRYAPQLLTMNSLNKMLQEKPTRLQKKEMLKLKKEIEIAKFRNRLLSQEKDKKSVFIRLLKQKHLKLVDENEERNSDLMENYYKLSRSGDKLKDFKRTVLQQREVFSNINSQLNQRRRQLLRELLFIFPIEMTPDYKFKILGIYLPNSDVLADSSDTGLSVALGYITHILIMSSIFLQVPLRYPLTHYGSRSTVTDNVSPLLPEREREFPLFTRGKDKAQFTYAVYLLNKNIAQLRWLIFMNTSNLKATLHNLQTFLEGHKEIRPEPQILLSRKLEPIKTDTRHYKPKCSNNGTTHEKVVSLNSIVSIANISDPILDCIRQDNQSQRSNSPTQRPVKKSVSQFCRNRECGRGLSEILAIPEAYLNKQISKDSLKNYMVTARDTVVSDHSCCDKAVTSSDANQHGENFIEVIKGKESSIVCDINVGESDQVIEEGHDPLNPRINIPSECIDICNKRLANTMNQSSKRISRSVGSYSDEEVNSSQLKVNFDMGSEPQINICREAEDQDFVVQDIEGIQNKLLGVWLEQTPNFLGLNKDMYTDECSSVASEQDLSQNTPPLMARTDALLNTKSFNLVKPKQ